MMLLLLVEGFGGNDDHPPPPTTTLFPTTTTICHINLREQENTNQNLLPTDLLLPNISLPSHLYHHHLPLELLHYPVFCTIHGCKLKLQHFTDAVVHFFPGFVYLEKSDVAGDGSSGNDGEVLCSGDMSSFLPLPYGKLPNMVCKRLWNTFVLQYSHTEGNVVTIVLSTVYTTGWVGIGFSKDGMMLNSSCMVGWVNVEGHARIKQYYVEGFTPSAVKPDKGELPLTKVPPYVALNGARIYLAFQLKYPVPLKRQPILLAYASAYPLHHHLSLHDDKTTIIFDFSSGNSDSASSPSGTFYRADDMKKTHGALSVLGWGLFLPYGAIVARYLRHRDPLWYYIHLVIEFLGFILGVAAAVVGLSLSHKLQVHIVGHKTIGIFVLVLSILQVLAFFARPSKDSKNRKYWNWYHSWSGRTAIFLAAVNIILGIHIGDAGPGWKICYGILLGLTLIACIFLETMSRLRGFDDRKVPPSFQMNGI